MPVKIHFQLLTLVLAAVLSYGLIKYINSPKNQTSETRLAEIFFYDKLGRKISLDAFKGKTVLVNLWASWCLPCVAELPMLHRLQEKLSADKFHVVAISMDRTSLEAIGKFLQEKGAKNLEVYWDKDRQIPLKWKYDGLPTSFLLDQEGIIVAQYNGPYEWDKDPQLRDIRVLLK